MSYEEDMYIKNIQKCYENGLLKESDLSTEEKISLSKLYERQIENLERKVSESERNLEICRERILRAKNKLK